MTTLIATPGLRPGTDAARIRRFQAAVWRFLRFLSCPRDLAEDLQQETFLAALAPGAGIPWEDPDRALRWLRGTARNLFFMHLRRTRRLPEIGDDAATAAAVDRHARDGGDAFAEALRDCLARLTPRARHALRLRYAEDASRRDMAEDLGLGEEGVKCLLQRLRRRLRACVEHRRGLAPAAAATDLDDRWLAVALEEELGAPIPDVADAVTASPVESRRRALAGAQLTGSGAAPDRSGWLPAAAVLLAVGALVWMQASGDRTAPGQDRLPQRGIDASPFYPYLVRPRDADEFAAMLGRVQHMAIVLRRAVPAQGGVELQAVPHARRLVSDAARLRVWTDALRKSTAEQKSFNGLDDVCELRLELDDGTRVVCTCFVAPQPRLGVGGEPFVLGDDLAALLKREVEALTRDAEVGAEATRRELRGLPDTLLRYECPPVRGIDVALLHRLTRLERLELTGPIDDRGAIELAKLRSLRTLHVDASELTDAGFAALGKLSGLRELVVRNAGKMLTRQGAAALRGLDLVRLRWHGGANLDAGAALALQGSKSLRMLGFVDAGRELLATVLPGLTGLPVLAHLELARCPELTGADLEPLARTKLTRLVLRDCRGIRSVDGVAGLPSLQHLDVRGTGVDPAAAEALRKSRR